MIILDTCVLIFDALHPKKLTSPAKKALEAAEIKQQLFCCDISLWEIAMLVQKKRLDPGTDSRTFLRLLLQAREIQVLNITLEVAVLAASHMFKHCDPADRLIAATAIQYNAGLITCDKHLRDLSELKSIW